MPRLPSFDSLHVFAVAARHLSFTAAAAELHRTQSAVSHRIKGLEAEIGVPLFTRLTRRLELTPAGQALARGVDLAIADISRTVAELDKPGEARPIRVTTLPSVASRWLMPRMSRFFDLHPDIEVHVIAGSQLLDLRVEGIDLAIRFGRGRYPGHSATLLMRDRVLPVCSPKFSAERGRITTVDALLELPLLHDSAAEGDGSLSDWRSWFDQLGRKDAPCQAGQRFNSASLLIEAAVLGLGVALGRYSLVADDLSKGALICPLPVATSTAFSYYLVALPEAAVLPRVVRFRHWLRAEAAATVSAAPSVPTRGSHPSGP